MNPINLAELIILSLLFFQVTFFASWSLFLDDNESFFGCLPFLLILANNLSVTQVLIIQGRNLQRE